MRTELITERAQLDGLVEPWWQLLQRTHEPTPFHAPEWLLPWFDELGGDAQPLWAAVFEGRDLVALAPFVRDVDREGPRLTLAGGGVTDYQGALVDPGGAAATEALLDFAAAGRAPRMGAWQRCAWWSLRGSDPLLNPRAVALGDEVTADQVCPQVDLPLDRAALLDGLPHHLGPKLLRDRRRMARLGACSWQREDDTNLADQLDWLFKLHAQRWTERGEAGVLAHPAVQSFHRRVARGLHRRGALRMHALRIDKRPIAALYGFQLGRRFFSYASGFEPALASFSPGRAIIAEAMMTAVDEGAQAFDFLRGAEPYKYGWGARDRTLHHRRLRLAL